MRYKVIKFKTMTLDEVITLFLMTCKNLASYLTVWICFFSCHVGNHIFKFNGLV